jgi:hypothetical protein
MRLGGRDLADREARRQQVDCVEKCGHNDGRETDDGESGDERHQTARRESRPTQTMPVHAAVTGRRSGLVAIAPTIKTEPR